MPRGIYKRTKEQSKKSVETRIKNGTNNFCGSHDVAIKGWKTRLKNGTDSWKTRRKNKTDKGFHWTLSEMTKEKMRIVALNRCSKNGQYHNIGNNEKEILDNIEKNENIIIDRKFEIIGYKPDGYCYETNTVYEVYESHHKKQIEKDLKRQKNIENFLNCKFIIIEDYR